MNNVAENYTLVPTVHGFVRKNHLLVCENYVKTLVTVIMKHPVLFYSYLYIYLNPRPTGVFL